MSNIINEDTIDNHIIKKFQFTSLGEDNNTQTEFKPFTFENNLEDEEGKEDKEVAPENENTKEASELLTKIEKLTEENLKLQLELENIQNDFEERLKHEKEESYKKGQEEGIKETTTTFQEQQDELKSQLIKSITNLDEKLYTIDQYLDGIKDSLVDSSILIAKKVIKKEVDENSKIVAKNIAQSFLSDLKDAKNVILKVNPIDATFLSEHFSSEKNIKIDPDDAINKGGIIILSDIGNIDGNIKTRIEKAIALIKQED